MMANQARVSFELAAIHRGVNRVTVPGFVPLANVPDKVWKKPRSRNAPYGRRGPENPNHYADIDLKRNGGPSLDELTPTAADLTTQKWRDYYDSIGATQVSERGMVPFRVWQLYKEMVGYVQQGQVAQFVAAAGVLSHYVGDACQPLHGSYLSDGDPFRHPDGSASAQRLDHGKGYGGVLSAYEGDMLDAHIPDLLHWLEAALRGSHGMHLVTGGQEAGFAVLALMRWAQHRIKPMDVVEAYAELVNNSRANQAKTVLWEKFGHYTIAVMADGYRTLAMLWESAWVEGGGQNILQSALRVQAPSRLKAIYERQRFAPSVTLDEIDQFL